MSDEGMREAGESCEAADTAQLRLIRNRIDTARESLVHAAAMRVASISLCDRLCNFAMSKDEAEAEELFLEIQAAWAQSKSCFRLLDVALSGA